MAARDGNGGGDADAKRGAGAEACLTRHNADPYSDPVSNIFLDPDRDLEP